VTWNDPIEIENYIKQVQARATDLIAENRKLRKVHISVTDMIIELMNIDLLKNRATWKENLGKMKRIIETVTKSRSQEMSKLWLTHLNY
jgi:dynein heavy chain 2